MLQLDDFRIAYGTRVALGPITLRVAPGQRIGIAGESGSGKTSLMHALAGVSPPSAQLTGRCSVSGRVGYVPQTSLASLSPFLPVDEQLTHLTGSAQRSTELLVRFGLEGLRRHRSHPSQLSGGERQRIQVAQGIAQRPSLVLADEPSSQLDSESAELVLRRLDEYLSSSGAGLLLASHDETAFRRLRCEAVYRLTPAPDQPIERPSWETGEILLDAQAVSKQYTRRDYFLRRSVAVAALRSATLQIHAGETVALVGSSGSGKSTLARCLARRERADSGDIKFRGSRPACVQLVPQEPSQSVNPRLTVGEVLQEAGARFPAECLEELRLEPSWIGRRSGEMSEGQRSRLAIARSLAVLQRGLLILDESLSSLDGVNRQVVWRALGKRQREQGLSILLITHDAGFALQASHRVLSISDGVLQG